MENIIEIQNLIKTFKVHFRQNTGFIAGLKALFRREFKTVTAVDDITLNIEKNKIHALIGPNGAGKSTIIKILSGVLYPTFGTVNIMGYIPWQERETFVKKIGVFLGQKGQLIWELPAIDSFEINRVIYKIPLARYQDNLNYFIEHFKLNDTIYKPVRNLSLGERMKCELVCTLLHDPQLIFLDEPFIGLDAEAKGNIRDFVKKINQEKNVTIILTTHDLNEIEHLCHKVTIINHGKIVFNDSIDVLRENFTDKKTVEIKFLELPEPGLLEELNFIKTGPFSGKINIDMKTTNLKTEILKILSELPVKDFNVHSPDIETIIKIIYQQKEIKYVYKQTLGVVKK